MHSSTTKPPWAPGNRLHHAKNRPIGGNMDHHRIIREAQRKQSIYNGMVLTVSTAHESFCSSIGDLSFDGEGSSKLFSIADSNQSCNFSQTSSFARQDIEIPTRHGQQKDPSSQDRWDSCIDKQTQPPNSPDKCKIRKDDDKIERNPGPSDVDKLKKDVQVVEEIVVPLSSRWPGHSEQSDKKELTVAKPIRRFATLSPVKRVRDKVEASPTTGIQVRDIQADCPLGLVSDRRSRSESEVRTSKEKAQPVQRNRSAGDRPFQFLQRMRGKSKSSNGGNDSAGPNDLLVMAHACETDRMMDHIAGTNELTRNRDTNLDGIKGPTRSISRRPTPALRKQRSKSMVGSSDLLQMAQCVSPSKARNTPRRSVSVDKEVRGKGDSVESNERIALYGADDHSKNALSKLPQRKYRHLKKQRSKSLVCSSSLTEPQRPSVPVHCSISGSYDSFSPVRPPAASRRAVSMTAFDYPPRQPQRTQHYSVRSAPATASRSSACYSGKRKDEDWQIASLDEDSTTIASTGINSEASCCPLRKQEDEMIVLALERSLKDSGQQSASSHSPPKSPEPCTRSDAESLFWVKEADKRWVALQVPILRDESMAENDLLEKVLKSSAMDTMKQVHLDLLTRHNGLRGTGTT